MNLNPKNPKKLRSVAARRWRSWERNLRFVAVWAAFITLTAFYLIPIIAIQAIDPHRPRKPA